MQILDRRTIAIPGPSADASPELIAAAEAQAERIATAEVQSQDIPGRVSAAVDQADIPGEAARVVASDPTVVERAAQAAQANASLSVTLTERLVGVTPDPLIGLSVVRGTPVFELPARQGTGSLRGGSVLRTSLSLPANQKRTVECFFEAPVAPTGSGDGAQRILFLLAQESNTGAVYFVSINADGTLRVISGGNNTNNKATGPVVVANGFHHLAVVVTSNGTYRKVEAAYVDGVALDGSLWSATSTGVIDSLYIGGLHTAAQFDSLPEWHTDAVRISSGARYTANFTPPQRLDTDASTLALFSMDPQSAGRIDYPQRPPTAPGLVTYVGNGEPSDWLVGDRWYQT